MSKNDIIKKFQTGDMNAFEEIFETYKNEALRYSYLITNNKFMSEDIVQEAFIKCYKSIHSLKNTEQFKAWFFKILTRTAWKYANKEKHTVPVEDIFETADDKSINHSINTYVKNEEFNILWEEIEKLELKQKTVIILYYFNELSIKEIAHIVGCFEGTVKSRLYMARKILKKKLCKNEKSSAHNIGGVEYESKKIF